MIHIQSIRELATRACVLLVGVDGGGALFFLLSLRKARGVEDESDQRQASSHPLPPKTTTEREREREREGGGGGDVARRKSATFVRSLARPTPPPMYVYHWDCVGLRRKRERGIDAREGERGKEGPHSGSTLSSAIAITERNIGISLDARLIRSQNAHIVHSRARILIILSETIDCRSLSTVWPGPSA